MKKLVIHPPLDARRLDLVQAISDRLQVINCETSQQAADEISDAQGFYGKITPSLLAEARQLQWVQSPTASLEHFLFPEYLYLNLRNYLILFQTYLY